MRRSLALVSLLVAATLGTGCALDDVETDEADVESDVGPDELSIEDMMNEQMLEPGEIAATSGSCHVGGVEVFENSMYSGGSHYFCVGDFADLRNYTGGLGWWATWNDRITDAIVSGQVKVWMYEHVGFKGEVKIFYPGRLIHFGGTIWNDAVSSIKVRRYP